MPIREDREKPIGLCDRCGETLYSTLVDDGVLLCVECGKEAEREQDKPGSVQRHH